MKVYVQYAVQSNNYTDILKKWISFVWSGYLIIKKNHLKFILIIVFLVFFRKFSNNSNTTTADICTI